MDKAAKLLVHGLGLTKKAGLSEDIDYARAKLVKDVADSSDTASNWLSDTWRNISGSASNTWNNIKGSTSSALDDARAYVKDRAGAAIRGGNDYLEDLGTATSRKLRDLKGNKYVDDLEDAYITHKRNLRDSLYSNADIADKATGSLKDLYAKILRRVKR